jgi:hypothetical protein
MQIVQVSSNLGSTGTTSATLSSGNGMTLPEIADHPSQIHDIGINIEVSQAVTTHSSGADIHRTSGA